jgi:hypothetical protein
VLRLTVVPRPSAGRPAERACQSLALVEAECRVDGVRLEAGLPAAAVDSEHHHVAIVGVPIRQQCPDPGDVFDDVMAADVVRGLVRQIKHLTADGGMQGCYQVLQFHGSAPLAPADEQVQVDATMRSRLEADLRLRIAQLDLPRQSVLEVPFRMEDLSLHS